jgi:hypothetical protein
MSQSFKIAITGSKELDRQLQAIAAVDGPNSVNAAMRKSTREAVKEIVLPEVRSQVPVETGFLESELKVKAIKRSRSKMGTAIGFTDDLFQGETFYAGFHEYGFHAPGGTMVYGDSFLRRPLYKNKSRVFQKTRDDLKRFIATRRK